MSDPVDQGPSVLSNEAVDSRWLAASADGALESRKKILRWYEPDLRLVGAVERALRVAAGDGGWEGVARALGPVLNNPASAPGEAGLARATEKLCEAFDLSETVLTPRSVLLGQAVADLVDSIELPGLDFTSPQVEFCNGVIIGVGEGLLEKFSMQVRQVKDLLQGVVDFYSLAYDINVMAELFAIWFDDPAGSSTEDLEAYLKNDYPDLWMAIFKARPLLAGLNSIVVSLRDDHVGDSGSSGALSAIADWIGGLFETLGNALKPHIAAIVAATGDAKEQGAIIGRVTGPLILDLVLVALDLVSLGRNVVEFLAKSGPLLLTTSKDLAGEALKYVRDVLRSTQKGGELTFVAAQAEKVAPGLGDAAAGVVKSTLGQITREWGEFGKRIAPYRLNSRHTGAWNKSVRSFTGMSKKDLEYALLHLQSQHILGDKWFKDFPGEFEKVFKDWPVLDSLGNPVLVKGQPLVVSWTGPKDMDALAIHAEAHIRSGERMAEDLGLFGAGELQPLETEMINFFSKLRRDKDGVQLPFKDLADVILAHKLYYQREQTRSLWPRLEKWFQRAEAAVAAAKNR